MERNDHAALQQVVVNGSGNGFEFYADERRFFIDIPKQVVYVEGTACSDEIRLDQPPDRDEEHVDLFLTVMEAVRECVRVGEPSFVVMDYMTTDDGLVTYYRVVHDAGYVAGLEGCRIVATVYPKVLS